MILYLDVDDPVLTMLTTAHNWFARILDSDVDSPFFITLEPWSQFSFRSDNALNALNYHMDTLTDLVPSGLKHAGWLLSIEGSYNLHSRKAP
jgi:hypothetical protein